MKRQTRLVGRRRWAALTVFLTKTMQEAKSERVRMQAAMRLADVLTLRTQQELAEMKAAARIAEQQTPAVTAPGAEVVTAEPVCREDALRQAEEFLARTRMGAADAEVR